MSNEDTVKKAPASQRVSLFAGRCEALEKASAAASQALRDILEKGCCDEKASEQARKASRDIELLLAQAHWPAELSLLERNLMAQALIKDQRTAIKKQNELLKAAGIQPVPVVREQ